MTGVNTKVIEATEVNGTQTEIWDLAGSPYIVTGTVIIPEGVSLTINPGVIVKFATDTFEVN